MDFKLSKTHLLQQEMYRRFAENEVDAVAEDMDETEEFDMELLAKMHKYGIMGIPYSKEYGGVGGDYLSYALAMEEISKVDGSTGITISVHTSLCCGAINEFGTEEQKQKFLRPLVDGTATGCYGLTEPNAGSDAAGVQTQAVLDEEKGEWTVNGGKIFTTNSAFADYCVLICMTDRSLGTKGMVALIVDLHSEGVTISANIKRMGIRAAQNCEVTYDNVKVPVANQLGKVGQGFKVAMKALDGGRIGIAAQSVGLAQGALDKAIDYIKDRKQFGRPIAAFQTSQFKCADMQTKIDAARLLVWRAAVAKDNHENYTALAAMAKLFASATANDVCREAVQLMGGYGYCREYAVERNLRDAKITEIYEGTSEVMKMVIAGSMNLKK